MNWDERAIREIYDRNFNMLYRICLIHMKSKEEALDMVQETFVRLLQRAQAEFTQDGHIDAWLRVTACNLCKNALRHWWRKKRIDVDEPGLLLGNAGTEDEKRREERKAVLAALLKLPQKYRILIYFHYYEEYQIKELGELLGENPSTLRSRLAKGKELLRENLKEAGINERDYERLYR